MKHSKIYSIITFLIVLVFALSIRGVSAFAVGNVLKLAIGQTQPLKAELVIPASNMLVKGKTVIWSSSNSKIAYVNPKSGSIKGIAPGKAIITAKVTGTKFSAVFNVQVSRYITKLSFDKEKLTIMSGGVYLIGTAITPSTAPFKDIKWKSSNVKVATVSKGKVTAVGIGSATITGTTVDGGCIDTLKVTVIKGVTGLNLLETKVSLSIGDNYQIKASVLPANAPNRLIQYYYNVNGIIKIDSMGVITPLKEGVVTVTLKTKNGGFKKSFIVYVKSEVKNAFMSNAEGLRIAKVDMKVGDDFSASVSDALGLLNKAYKIKWTSSKDNIAKVNSAGTITGIANGVTTIYAEVVQERTLTKVSLVVTVHSTVKSITFDTPTLEMGVGGKTSLAYQIMPTDAFLQKVKWSSSNNSIVKVSNGNLVAIAKGKATITVTTLDGNHIATCKVNVTAPVQIVITKKLTLNMGNISNVAINSDEIGGEILRNLDVESSDKTISTAKKSSTDSSILVTGLKEGKNIINVTTTDMKYKIQIQVTVLYSNQLLKIYDRDGNLLN